MSICSILNDIFDLDGSKWDKVKSCWKCKNYKHTDFERGKCELNKFQPKSFFMVSEDEDVIHSKYRYCNEYKP